MADKKDLTFILTFDAKKGTASIQKFGKTTKAELAKMRKAAESAAKGTKTLSDGVEKQTSSMNKGAKASKGMWKQMAGGMGVMMGVQGAIRMVKRAITDTINTGREFERTWANVTTMLTISEGETAKLHNELLALSPTLGDTTDLAKGMYQVLSASVDPAEAIMFLGEAAKSAQAGVTDTATAVDALTTVINAYGMQATDVTKVSDIMFQTVKRGKLTYEGMAGAIGTIAPIAAQVGVSFEEIGAAMATLTRQGIDVNTTTVQLRQILVSVLKPTSEAQKMAQKLGIAFNSTALKSKGLAGFLKEIKEKVGSNAEAMTALFGNVRALTGIMGLAGSRAEEFTHDLDLMKNASGATAVAFEKQMKSGDFWMKTMKNTIGKLQIALYEGFIGPMKKGVNSGADLDKKIKELIESARNFGTTIANLIKTFGGLLDQMAQFGRMPDPFDKHRSPAEKLADSIWKKLIPSFKTAREQVAENREEVDIFLRTLKNLDVTFEEAAKQFRKSEGNWIAWTEKIKAADDKLTELGVTMMVDVMNPMSILQSQTNVFAKEVTDLGMGIDAIIEKKRRWKGQIDVVAEANAKLVETIHDMGLKTKTELGLELEIMVDKFNAVRESNKLTDEQLSTYAKKIVKLAEDLGVKLSPALLAAAGAFKSVYEATSPWDKSLKDLGGELGTIPTKVDTVSRSITGLSKVVGGGLGKILDDTKKADKGFGLWDFTIAGTANTFKTTNEKIDKGLIKTGKQTDKTAKTMKERMQSAAVGISAAFRTLSDDIGGVWGDILNTGATAIESIGNLFSNLEGGAKASFTDIASAAGPALGQLGGMIGGLISGAKKNFAGLGQSLGSAVGSAFGPVGKAVGGILGGLVGGLFKKAETEAEKAARLLKERTESVTKSLKHLGDVSEATAETIAEDMADGMSEATAIAANYADVIRDVGITQENVNDLWHGATNIIGEYRNGTLDAATAAESAGDSFTELLQGAQRMGTEGSKAMVGFIKQVKQSGLEVAEVTDYINDQLGVVKEGTGNASEGLLAMAEHIGLNEEAMGRLESQTMAVFNAMIENGASMNEAMTALGPTLDIMAQKYEQMGITGGEGFQELMKIREVTEANQGLMSAIQGNLDVLSALANTGSLTKQTLNEAAGSAKAYYAQLLETGLSGNQALAQMAPTLEKLRDMSIEHGYALDENTQALIDEAEAAGVLGETQASATDIMMAGFGEIIRALGGDIPAAFQKSIDKMKNMGEETSYAEEKMKMLENTIHGRSVTSAVDALGKVASDVLGKMQSDTEHTAKVMGGLEGEISMTEKELKNLGLRGRQWGESLVSDINDVEKGFEKMGKSAQDEFGGMEGSINDVGGALGDLSKMAKRGFKIKYSYQETGGGGGGGQAQGAQHGVDEIVTGPKNYHVEPGVREHVKITPIKTGETVGGGTTIIERPLIIKPLVVGTDELGNMIIEFLEEAAENEVLALPPKGIRKS